MSGRGGPTLRRLAGHLGLRVLTGDDLLDRPIRWVFTTDLPDPGRYLAGGELVLTGLMWRRRAADSEAFVAAVAARGAVGVAAGTAALGEVPHDLVTACARHDLPLLEVPAELSFAVLARRVLAERPPDPAGRRQELLAAVAGSGGLAAPVALVAEELERPCWLLSPTGRTMAASGPPLPAATAEAITTLFHGGGRQAHRARLDGQRFALCPLPCDLRTPPCFLAVESDEDLELADIAGDLAVALEHDRARCDDGSAMSRALAERLVGGLLDDDRSRREIGDLMTDLGLPADRTPAAVAIEVTGPGGSAVARFLIEEAAGPATAVAIGDREAETLALAGAAPRELAEHLRTAVRLLGGALTGHRISVGVSGTASSGLGPREALQEARNARRLAALGRAPVAVTAGDEIDSVDLLIAAMPRGVRDRFRKGLIGELEAYDESHGARLRETLAAFLALSGSWQRCAAELHVHVNTVRYRLRRVEEFTGRDLSRFPDRVDLFLALRLADWERAI
ncbi:PucR family transcriptional regulator ligand-binding domain-containing protein [Actinomadura barringtoniae]|uniref:PucR family transcriptional regulator ligand-binding domain-containing protein n=1 Tax=Actinomadura barringtoniae TaxID=1427535 RepID=A0A939T910_9ACTN|nr:PucR family transcriptional regulator [Actinomadura barringtoniae]MBO2447490.1 PucR family transcriptional regulator ligand-binding domain-containing protein [Actinomadura barringtoniae]